MAVSGLLCLVVDPAATTEPTIATELPFMLVCVVFWSRSVHLVSIFHQFIITPDGSPYGNYIAGSMYGVAVVTFPWSRSSLDGHSGGMWGTIQDGMFQTADFGTMTLHGVA